jgi:hypothetical protein
MTGPTDSNDDSLLTFPPPGMQVLLDEYRKVGPLEGGAGTSIGL